MPKGDPLEGFVYPTLTLMIKSYNLGKPPPHPPTPPPPRNAKRLSSGRIFLSYPHTFDRFLL